ncbi:MAG: hypothetical protein C4582_07765 [Desulfobacteraceae bacterium]|jgi:hypothetical protein|nr:MAG: hypothetical protein C4582_07765 [Desulfobacteraceae bacterium]
MLGRFILRVIPLTFLFAVFYGGYLVVADICRLPFRATNDELHRSGSPLTLDILIPAGVHIDEKITIGDVARLRLKKEGSVVERSIRYVSGIIPPRYRLTADLMLFFFWSFLYMIFLRVFTFAGYGRSMRISLFFGGITYYFMPDFSAGLWDDAAFIGIPILVIIATFVVRRRKKERYLA